MPTSRPRATASPRAQWAVLAKVERTEGLKQDRNLAEQMGDAADPHADPAGRQNSANKRWIEPPRRTRTRTGRVNHRLYLKKAATAAVGKNSPGCAPEITTTATGGDQPRRRPNPHARTNSI